MIPEIEESTENCDCGQTKNKEATAVSQSVSTGNDNEAVVLGARGFTWLTT